MMSEAMMAVISLPGGMELVIILLVIILLFGAKKLPQLARSLGESINEFKKGKQELDMKDQVEKAETSSSQDKKVG